MDILPFVLVMVSSFTHALWNLLAKRSGHKDVFLGLSKVMESLIFSIPFLVMVTTAGVGRSYFWFVLVAAFFVFLNYFFLSNSYRKMDFSLAYPVSRSSTLFLPLVAFLLLGETIDGIGWGAIILILAGVLLMYGEELKGNSSVTGQGMAFALLAALSAACYTAWDKMAVSRLHPFLYFYGYTLITGMVYGFILARREAGKRVRAEWNRHWKSILGVAVLNTFTYLLVLVALGLSKATYVGALRQVSLMFGLVFGWKFLNERISFSRILGVALIISGTILTLFAG